MSALSNKAFRGAPQRAAPLSVGDLVLLRVAASACTRAELQRDLAVLVAPKISGTVFRREAELAIGNHANRQFINDTKGKLAATALGSRAAEAFIVPAKLPKSGWDDLRNAALMAQAIGIAIETPALAKALERPEGLAALVLQQHFGLSLTRVLSPNDLRTELAVLALEKAFGNKIKTGLAKSSGLPSKTGRLLAGQLFKKPREVASDGKLVTLMAAEILDAPAETLEGLRLALLRRLTGPRDAIEVEPKQNAASIAAIRAKARTPEPANDASPLNSPPPLIARPDLSEFVCSVLDAARPVSEGWPGNHKAFISRVWKAIRTRRPEWELTEIAFKSMLAEAHRTGHLVLAAADLKDKNSQVELEESKILYKNTVWHFVRVED